MYTVYREHNVDDKAVRIDYTMYKKCAFYNAIIMFVIQCTMYNVQCTMYTHTLRTAHGVQCTHRVVGAESVVQAPSQRAWIMYNASGW